jgi:hypothetical protein
LNNDTPESAHAPTLFIDQELQIIQHGTAPGPAPQDLFPPALVLEAVRKRDVVVCQRKVLLRQLLQPDDDGTGGGLWPRARVDEGGACGGILVVGKDATELGGGGGALDRDGETGGDEGANSRGGEGAVLEGLLLRAQVDRGERRHFGCWREDGLW